MKSSNNKKISNFEFGTLNYFITRAFLIGITFNTIISIMKQDSWIISIISIMPAIIFILLINYIFNYEPDLDLSQKLIKLFKKKAGTCIIVFLTFMGIFICILNYLTLNNFIQSQFLSKTPLIFISIMFIVISIYILNKGITTISRTGVILFYISIIMIIISILGLIPSFKIDNLKPFFTSSIDDYIKSTNIYYAFNTIPMILLTSIPKNKIDNPKIKNSLIISYVLSAITLFLIIAITISIFGYELTALYEYPEFLVLKHFSLLGLSSRIESILIMQLLFDILIFNIMMIYFLTNNIKTIFNMNKTNLIYFIISVLIIFGTSYVSKINVYIDSLIKSCIPIIISITTTLLILLISMKIKISKQ